MDCRRLMLQYFLFFCFCAGKVPETSNSFEIKAVRHEGACSLIAVLLNNLKLIKNRLNACLNPHNLKSPAINCDPTGNSLNRWDVPDIPPPLCAHNNVLTRGWSWGTLGRAQTELQGMFVLSNPSHLSW